ncbi:MAG: DUF2344 domain-containing protein [Lachnospiraceae bacterium]|nr:DUF2344 domain-containing protein [Lachnospiraceae bacterium]
MRIRIKFTKLGNVKFIGHLDLMRYFQKLMRRSGIPIAYSAGMSPHQIMSFALPLGIGDESIGEYADIELTGSVSSTDAIRSLSEHSAEGIEILSFKMLPDDAKNAMASVEAADYEISFRHMPENDFYEAFAKFMQQDSIIVMKRTKKSEREIDLRPLIFAWSIENKRIRLRLKCGSVDNTKPELVMEAFFASLGLPFDPFLLLIKRIDLFTEKDGTFISLDEIGADI